MQQATLLIIYIYLSLCISPSFAADSQIREPLQELYISEMAFTQEEDEIQLTTGLSYASFESSEHWTLPIASEYGLSDQLQLGLEIPVINNGDGEFGVGNLELGISYNFYNSTASGLVVTAGLEWISPSVSEDFADEKARIEPQINAYKTFGAVDLNIGLSFETALSGSDESSELAFAGSVAVIYPFQSLVSALEFSVEFEDDEISSQIATSLTRANLGDWEFGLALGAGLSGEAADWQILSSMSWEFELESEEQ